MKCHTNDNSTSSTQLPHKFSYIVAILGHNHFESPNRQKWMQRGKKDSKNKTKRLRGGIDTRLHQVIRKKGFYNVTLKERGEKVSLKSNAVLSNKKRKSS
jgi:hypothetical protein